MNKIRERRLALKMTQKDLSRKLQAIDPRMGADMVIRFEEDVCLPTGAVLKGLETALQAPRRNLFPAIELYAIEAEASGNEGDLSPSTKALAQLIPKGKTNAVSRQRLASLMQCGDREMREAIRLARQEGLVIINDQDGKGYYCSDDVKDIKRQRDQTYHRAMSLLVQAKHLNARLPAKA